MFSHRVPRVGKIQDSLKKYGKKILYGTAFRNMSCVEQMDRGGGFLQDLDLTEGLYVRNRTP